MVKYILKKKIQNSGNQKKKNKKIVTLELYFFGDYHNEQINYSETWSSLMANTLDFNENMTGWWYYLPLWVVVDVLGLDFRKKKKKKGGTG